MRQHGERLVGTLDCIDDNRNNARGYFHPFRQLNLDVDRPDSHLGLLTAVNRALSQTITRSLFRQDVHIPASPHSVWSEAGGGLTGVQNATHTSSQLRRWQNAYILEFASFLRMIGACSAPLSSRAEVDSWIIRRISTSGKQGCDRLVEASECPSLATVGKADRCRFSLLCGFILPAILERADCERNHRYSKYRHMQLRPSLPVCRI